MTAAEKLEGNPLLAEILNRREQLLIQRWRMADSTLDRERCWHGIKQLEELAGAIEDAIRAARY
jgi:hypothetical protein